MGILAMLAVSGALGGALFWFIRRPDRDRVPTPVAPDTRPTDDAPDAH